MHQNNNIWRFEELANKYLSLIPHDLSYFGTHFIGVALGDTWEPPSITIAGKSKKIADVVSWMIKSPVVSEKMKLLMQNLCGDDTVQFLRFHDLKNKPYYAMNVLAVMEDIVDLEKTNIRYFEDTQRPCDIDECIFSSKISDMILPPVFKTSINGKLMSNIYVSQPFVDMAIAEKLTGFALMNPARSGFQALLHGENDNDVEGIVG